MSNFEDYDLTRGAGTRSRANRTPNRVNNGAPRRRPDSQYSQGQMNYDYDMSLDDEMDMYNYDLQGEAMDQRMPRQGVSRQGTARSAGARTGASRQGQPRRSSQPVRHSASHPGTRSSSSRSGRGGSSRPSSAGASRRPSSSKKGNTSRKNKKKKTRRTVIVVEVVILLVLALVFFLWNKISKIDTGITYEKETNDLDEATVELLSNYTTIALFGVDNRSTGNTDSGNSDTIMIAAINNDTKEVKLVSVQRDTYLKVEDDKYRKCNYAYGHSGPDGACNMLNANLDISVDGFVAVDFWTLATIVDDLGGLELEITQKMINTDNPDTHQNALAGYIAEVENVLNYHPDEEDGWKKSDCYFDSPGTYKLNGAQVVGYCRNRYAVDNDYGRAANQRMVVNMIVEKAKKADLVTLNKITDHVFEKMSTNLSKTQLISMATAVKDYEIVGSSGFPFDLTTGTFGSKGSLVVPCTLSTNVVKLHEYLYDQQDYTVTESVQAISDKVSSDTGTSEGSATVNQTPDSSQ
ncbi:transcriptional attenuator, LytR family [Pseudobutyrivibrio sp. AR14]|uniref:LCP family protein n=1 Tax=Pseudobutyrivibrio sp. AR14 TaxID=1520804 RepID=UPI00089140F0|nr:LCP family protein [Pseudobutyrivibrio sp. AR14]SCX91087.1 transcriptional attenuator, LytR family [Pseudobutyrivibrio sp. AR14]